MGRLLGLARWSRTRSLGLLACSLFQIAAQADDATNTSSNSAPLLPTNLALPAAPAPEVTTSAARPSEAEPEDSSPFWWSLNAPADGYVATPEGVFSLASYGMFQEVPPLSPQLMPVDPTPPTTANAQAMASIFRGGAPRSTLPTTGAKATSRPVTGDSILGAESKARSTSDLGSLLGESANSRGVSTQKRNPIITDPRVRGSRVGQLNASGSYWVPARADLDTMLSKIDSRLIDRVDVVKGPYAVQYGPGFDFIDFTLAHSPRFEDGLSSSGASSLDYQTNGEQWYGRQTFSVGDRDWGARVSYGHRTGSDYQSGSGIDIPSSYNSRDLDLAFGWDFAEDRSLEVHYLRLDQTGVELAGQAFDLDFLTTDGVEITLKDRSIEWADELEVETWYNQTRLAGSAQTPAKRRTFPFLNVRQYVGFTNVETQSTGARLAASWELDDDRHLSSGTDFRFVRQELDEYGSGRAGFSKFTNADSPIPRSFSANPGLFAEIKDESIEDLRLTAGVRADVVATEVTDTAARMRFLGNANPQSSLAGILGTGDFDQTFGLWSMYLNAEYAVDEVWTLYAGAGHGQRAPSLTELYAAQPFMFLLQNGLNTVTGDPRLNPERRWQIDLGTGYDDGRLHARANVFHAWVLDAITFENVGVVPGPPNGQIEQVNLKYVNTDLATLAGFEANADYDINQWLELFSTMSYVQGTDHSRNGHFRTTMASGAIPSQQLPGVRGQSSGITAGDREALPQMPPLEARLGTRLNAQLLERPLGFELSARIVDDQERVARSLVETGTPGFTTYDLRSFWRPKDNLTVMAGVENFTNKDYREHFDFRSANPNAQVVRQMGINFYFGSELTY